MHFSDAHFWGVKIGFRIFESNAWAKFDRPKCTLRKNPKKYRMRKQELKKPIPNCWNTATICTAAKQESQQWQEKCHSWTGFLSTLLKATYSHLSELRDGGKNNHFRHTFCVSAEIFRPWGGLKRGRCCCSVERFFLSTHDKFFFRKERLFTVKKTLANVVHENFQESLVSMIHFLFLKCMKIFAK